MKSVVFIKKKKKILIRTKQKDVIYREKSYFKALNN